MSTVIEYVLLAVSLFLLVTLISFVVFGITDWGRGR
jgi:hypothetical protein